LGLTTSLDTNWDPSGQWQGINEILPQVDVFLPNEKEALALARTTDLESAVEQIAATCRMVAIKLGRGGAIARRGDTTARAPAVKVDVVDTIGAGDAFDAGFLYGFLHGWELEKSLSLATACGSLSTRRAGGTAAQPGLEEAMQHVPHSG
jgi:sugar/nucleoside kinase (ribokinase family)